MKLVRSFAGVLPEEESRRLIAQTFGVSDKNDFALLERIGAECAGAVALLPHGELPVTTEPHYQEITTAELAGKLAELPRRPLLAGEKGIRLSLAGAQGKLVLKIHGGRMFLSLDGFTKQPYSQAYESPFAGLVENEFFCMRLASEVGLETANVEIGMAGDIRYLRVERYDRRELPDGRLERIHQEDFCQALGIAPELKYQQEGGPNLKKCFELVRSISTIPGPDLLRLFDAIVFNYLIGNCDAHGKNFSFLREGATVRLAPLYDLVSTQAYPDLANQLAMKIGGEKDPKRLIARNWRVFFTEAEIGQAVALQRLRTINGRVMTAAAILSSKGCIGGEKILPIIEANHRLLESLRFDG